MSIIGDGGPETWAALIITLVHEAIGVAAIVFWMIGVAVAKGFWMVLFTSIFPPAAWVVAAKHFLGV